ncbi:M1 family aminopeptidase [Dyadobacter sp. CY345]|uniref:M1 family metallopeptidase n=1 Tax=Dyadobacter sp. CY345 TaxID=2909335 RepID=UPI001F37C94C|nr:M1 family aminopeptidase [Dyadobacter sp. CY345]MCF2447573.1 M1 family aminopeptidase [Dyadobacter sp. CY345]
MKIRSLLIFLVSVSLLNLSCKTNKEDVVEKGVSFPLNAYRKKTIDSIQYVIELNIPSKKIEKIRGTQTILFNLNTLDSALVLDFSNDQSQILSVKSGDKIADYKFVNEHIIINPGQLVKGKNRVTIEFIAGDLSLNRNEEYLYTLFVPDRASTCFPLFDQPNLKASYQLTLKTPGNWEAVSNGKLKEKAMSGDTSIYQFEETKPISSYLFAFAAGKFFKATKTIGDREMTMYYRETDSVKVNRNRDEVFNLHAKAVTWLEEYTAIEYPFGKFDFVLLPSFQYGGMEHPGAVFYNESALFLDENPPVNRQLARASVIAHESAHMWFGDLVTMDWFNDVWLKEVFANFMAAKIVHPSFPQINHKLRFLLAHYPRAYEVDRSAGTNPILQNLGNLKNAGTLYGGIIYQKAPIVMRQLEKKIGQDMMRESLREYLKKYSFGNARWDDLIGIIDKKSPLDIADWSNVWVKTPGMPEYELIGEKEEIEIRQKQDSVSDRVWQQPAVVFWKEKFAEGKVNLNLSNQLQSVRKPDFPAMVFPNSDGEAYGYFKMDSVSEDYFFLRYDTTKDTTFANPVFRGAMLVNIWEGFLRGDGAKPERYLIYLSDVLQKEDNALISDYLLGNIQTIWWTFLTDQQRKRNQENIEQILWSLLEKTPDKGMKNSYFRAFRNVALTESGLRKLEVLWNDQLKVKDLVLSEDDKISLAYELALKGHVDAKGVLAKQLSNTKNPDRRAKMEFVIPAISQDEVERDKFFESLRKEENREHEAWVLEALPFLHHPLRSKSALKYLRPSLDLLQEVQLTGDIFFPQRWLHSTFSGHSEKEAANIVNTFLKEKGDYPYYLKNKILQSTDLLDRAIKLKQ